MTGRADDGPGHVWVDGALLPADARHLSVYDRGFQLGDGVFETLKAIDGRPFATRRHLERLRRSADGLELRVPFGDDELRAAMAEVLASQPLPLCGRHL